MEGGLLERDAEIPHFPAFLKPKKFYLWPQSGGFLQLQHTKPRKITANTVLGYLVFPRASTGSRPRRWGEALGTTAGWATAQGSLCGTVPRTKRAFQEG